jgi:phage terminase large subunit-like protein
MVEATLRVLDPNVSYTAVRASRGKVTRAEPIAALYVVPGRKSQHHAALHRDPQGPDRIGSLANQAQEQRRPRERSRYPHDFARVSDHHPAAAAGAAELR